MRVFCDVKYDQFDLVSTRTDLVWCVVVVVGLCGGGVGSCLD